MKVSKDIENADKQLIIPRGPNYMGILFLVHFVLGYLFLAISVNGAPLPRNFRLNTINRTSFPPGFVFGAGTSAYQIEGAAYEDGKGASIWDTWTRNYPDRIRDHSNGTKANDGYHRYKEDVRLIKQMNMDAYRFSISWPRVLPNGKRSGGGVNEHGVAYYNSLINELRNNGIEPYVTLFHWDLPQVLEDEYGGFLSSNIVDDFRDYAELCFSRFGDRVKYWITLNEPYTYSTGGYEFGFLAPGRCSAWRNPNCTGGDSAIEPYLVTHNLLLAHGAAAHLYKDKYQATQKGNIGITLVTRWMVPYTDNKIDRDAAIRALDFELGWYLNPLTFGDYPQAMRDHVTDRLPLFTLEESYMLRKSCDFLGLNYYTSDYVQNVPVSIIGNTSRTSDSRTNITSQRNGVPIGGQSASYWLYDYPKGMHDLLVYIRDNYNNPTIYITENGIDEVNNSSLPLQNALQDDARIAYYSGHLSNLRDAISDGANVKGFFAWSLMDVFEWDSGYTVRFGLNFVDYKDGLRRYQKNSATWFANFLRMRN